MGDISLGLTCVGVCVVGTQIIHNRSFSGNGGPVLKRAGDLINDIRRTHEFIGGKTDECMALDDELFTHHLFLLRYVKERKLSPPQFLDTLGSTLSIMERVVRGDEVYVEDASIPLVVEFFNAWSEECQRNILISRHAAGDDE